MPSKRLPLTLALAALLTACGGDYTEGEPGDMGAGRPENAAPDTNPPPPAMITGPEDTLPASQQPTTDR